LRSLLPNSLPFDDDAFSRSCREMIEAIFTRGLRPGQRWGFKEIRYHRVLTVRFLEKLLPDARFITLRRDIRVPPAKIDPLSLTLMARRVR